METADDCGDALRATAQPLDWRSHRASRSGRGDRPVARRPGAGTGGGARTPRRAPVLSAVVAAIHRVRTAGGVRGAVRSGAGANTGVSAAIVATTRAALPVPHAHVA